MADNGKRSILDSIPGWSGYRDRERRRESDRLLRERLAQDYGEVADSLGRLATRLAEDRKLSAIRFVDRPHARLTHFVDRLKSATYGYAGLFSDRPVDAKALDQIADFDASLGDGLADIARAADDLAETNADQPDFRDRSEHLVELIESMHDRFDQRSELIESGEVRPAIEIDALLATNPGTSVAPTAYQLHDGDGITYQSVNYTVIGRISIETATDSWRAFQLRGGDGQSWLHVPTDAEEGFYWCRRVEHSGKAGDRQVRADDKSYMLQSTEDGSGEVIGSGGSSGSRELTIYTYDQTSGNSVLKVYYWRVDEIALVGEPIDPAELELWSREGGRAV